MNAMTARFAAKASRAVSRPTRSVIEARISIALAEPVARAAHRVQDRPLEPLLQLAPQAADMDVDDVGPRIEMIVPHLLEQHRPGHHPPLVAGEIFEQPVFPRLQIDLPPRPLHRTR